MEGLAFAFDTSNGVPVLADAAARITADCHARHDCGDHSLFVGHIRTMMSDGRQPLAYHAGHYPSLARVHGPETPQPEFW
ncbi:MAG: flavin reductase family protein [Hyphomicrobiales bacterium]|nr:flavin reductase family protein [Hyphomicrobiales bacterium]